MGTDIEPESASKSDCLNPAHPPRDDHRIFVPELHAAKGAPVPGSPGMLELHDTTLGIDPAPDGGWKAYSVCFGAFLCNFCIFGFSTAFGQLKVYYLDHQLADSNESEVGWIASISFFLIYINSMFAGRYFDAHGTKTLMSSGTALQIGGKFALAFCQTYWQFFLAHTAVGLAGSIMYAPSMAVTSHWFAKKRSTMVCIVGGSSALGGTAYTVMFRNLLSRLSFRDGMLIVAGMTSVFLIIACLTIRARLPPRQPAPWRSLVTPWRERRYFCLALGTSIVLLNWASPYFNAPIYARSNHTSAIVRDYSVVWIQLGSFLGRISAGFLADRLGVWKVFASEGTISAVVLFALWIPRGLTGAPVVIGLIFYGIMSGAWMSLVTASCAAISPLHENGSRLGMIWTLCALPSLAGPVICGALIDRQHGSFQLAAVFSAITILGGVVITVVPVIMRYLAEWSLRRKG